MSQRIRYNPEKYPDEYWEKYRNYRGQVCAWDVPNEELEYVIGWMYHRAYDPVTKTLCVSSDMGYAVTTPEGFVIGELKDYA